MKIGYLPLYIKLYDDIGSKREAMEKRRIEINDAEMMHALESRPKITTEEIELDEVKESI